MSVGIDKPGHQHVVIPHDMFARLETGEQIRHWPERHNLSAVDDNGMTAQCGIRRRDGQYPTGLEQQIGGFFSWHRRAERLKTGLYATIPLSPNTLFE